MKLWSRLTKREPTRAQAGASQAAADFDERLRRQHAALEILAAEASLAESRHSAGVVPHRRQMDQEGPQGA